MVQNGVSRFYVTPLSSPPSKPDAPPTQRRYHYLDYQPPTGVPQKATLLLLHGFPDFSNSWRNVVSPLSMSGYRVIVPDLLGYGLSSAPPTAAATPGGSRLAEYGGRAICTDLNGLLDYAKAGQGAQYGSNTCDKDGKNGRVIILSHDWGGWLGWRMVQWFPHRVMGAASCCVPFAPPTSKYLDIDTVLQRLPNFGYQKFFSDEKSTKIIEDNLELFFTIVYAYPGLFSGNATKEQVDEASKWHLEGNLEKLLTSSESNKAALVAATKSILDPKELEKYVQVFKSRGMEGPLSWYRTRRVNWEEDRALTEKTLPPNFPALMLCPTEDIAVPPFMGHAMKNAVPSTKVIEIPGSGHFVQNEMPNVVVSHFKQWIDDTVLPAEQQGSVLAWIKSKL